MAESQLSNKGICKNCGHSYHGNFCNHCGQKSDIRRIDFKYLKDEIQQYVFQVKKGYPFTIKELVKSPGSFIREYIDGKRIGRIKPTVFILVLSIVLALLSPIFGDNTLFQDALEGYNEGIQEHPEKHTSDTQSIGLAEWMINHYAYAALMMIPVFSLASYLAFRKAKYNFFEHFVLNSYSLGLITLFLILWLPIVYIINEINITALSYSNDLLKSAFMLGIAFIVYFQFFKDLKRFSRILNFILTYCLFLLFFTCLMLILGFITLYFSN